MKKVIEQKKQYLIEDCEVLDEYKNKVVIKISDKENIVARKNGKIKTGDKVSVSRKQNINRLEEIFIYISPIYYLILGLALGFLFNNGLYHYLLILGLSIFGIAELFVIKFLIKKVPFNIYVATKIECENA